MSDEKKKPTHLFKGLLDNGAFVAHAWTETYQTWVDTKTGEPSHDVQTEGYQLTPEMVRIYKADGTTVYIMRNRLLWFEVGPWKELPESVKLRLEKAQAQTGPGVH
jgi:hypothetical protein